MADDRSVAGSPKRRRVVTSPLLEEIVKGIQAHRRGGTFSQSLAWFAEDATWCTDPALPAYGRWSPVMASILREALERVASQETPAPETQQ